MLDRVLPIDSDDDVLALVREVIGSEGGARTTWLLLLDDTDRPLPQVVPIDGVPPDPDPEDVAHLVTGARMIAEACDAASLIVVWERPGPAAVRMQEADWAAALSAAGLPLRAQVLATDEGVRLLDPDFEPIIAI